jgi:hypothetical protein
MVAARKIPDEEVTDARELLRLAEDQPIVVEFRGRRFRVIRESEELAVRPTPNNPDRDAIWENYDPDEALAAMQSLFGYYKKHGIDAEKVKREIREERGQFSKGRPYDPE